MRRIALLILSLAFLSPAFADSAVKEKLAYLGQGVFSFGDKAYVYGSLLDALRAAHPDEHIDLIVVDMGAVAGEADKAKVCQLRQALQTQVKMHLVVDGEKRELFCN